MAEKFQFIEDVNFDNALFLPDSGEPPYIQIDISHDSGDYFIYTKPVINKNLWLELTPEVICKYPLSLLE